MPHQDRRNAARYPAVEDQARVGWWEGEHFRTTPARIEDISTGGAAITIGPEALATPAVWMCLAGTAPDEWVQAQLAGVATAEDGSQVVRLAFPLSCPYDMFKTVAWGEPAPPSPAPSAGLEAPPAAPASDPPARPTPAVPSGGEAASHVVVVTLPFEAIATLCQAERSVRASKDRVGGLSRVAAFAVCLALAAFLGVLVYEKLERLRFIESILNASRP